MFGKLFAKKIPAACPKCGKSDGWHCIPEEPKYGAESSANAVNPFSSAPIRGTFGGNMTGRVGKTKKPRWRCDNCGFEKRY